jgi:hypothetical protein
MMNTISQMAISTQMIHHSHIEERLVQEDTREVGPVDPVDLRVELVHTLHLFKPILCLGGFPDLYIHSSKEDSCWDN